MTMTRMRISLGIRAMQAAVLGATIAALGAGCATMPTVATPATGASAQSDPARIWDCGLVSSGSPSKYVCNGKVYTTFQLAKIRADEIKKYESGK